MESSKKGLNPYYKAIVVLIILNSLGFPGNYTLIFGNAIDSLIGYACFLLEIVLMLFSSAGSAFEIRLLDLKYKYRFIYLLLVVFFINSMLATSFPQAQLVSCVRFSVTVLFALWLCEKYDIEGILELIYYAEAIYLILSFAFLVLKPGIAYSSSEGGFTFLRTAKNSAATQLLTGIIMQTILLKCKLEKHVPISRSFLGVLVGQIIALFMCNSVGAILCLAIVLLYTFVIYRRMGRQYRLRLGLWYIVINIAFLVIMLTIAPMFSPVFEMLGKDATLTGRTLLWNQIIEVMSANHTLQGYGYAMFWRDPSGYSLIHRAFDRNSWLATMTTGAHNVILELWLNVGLVGLSVYFLTMIQSMSRTKDMTETQYLMCSAHLIAFALHGLTERAFVTYDYQTLFLFLTMAIGCSVQPNRRRPRWIKKSVS